jgi:hypothetical protein
VTLDVNGITKRQQLMAEHDQLRQMLRDVDAYGELLARKYGVPGRVNPTADVLAYFKEVLSGLSRAEATISEWEQPVEGDASVQSDG